MSTIPWIASSSLVASTDKTCSGEIAVSMVEQLINAVYIKCSTKGVTIYFINFTCTGKTVVVKNTLDFNSIIEYATSVQLRKNNILKPIPNATFVTSPLSYKGFCSPIFECNSCCGCPANCINRLSQQGVTIKLQVFQTEKKGLGVRTLQSIPKDRFVCEYSGEIISYGEAKLRTKKSGKTGKNYLLVLKEHVTGGKVLRTHIDATAHGNVARFMNHSCEPNMHTFPVRVNSPVPRLCLIASRDIDLGEELTFSYGDTACEDDQNQTNAHQNGKHKNRAFLMPRTNCLCGSRNCTGYLPFDECLYDS